VAFSGMAKSYCIGLVDICDSTKISANMNEKEWASYYSFFLNTMAKIIPRYGGVPLKNGGDSLLYYFPESAKPRRKYGFTSCIECSLNMLESHDSICENLVKEGLPCLNYRVSSDFGKVILMKTGSSQFNDLIGPPVNMCAKINHRAPNNGYVVGGDFYQHVKTLSDYKFHPEQGFSIGLKYAYPIYSVDRDE
jgi:class 3 adenylate cyclase